MSRIRPPELDIRRELDLYWDGRDVVFPSTVRQFSIERRNQRRLHAALTEFAPDVVAIWGMGALSLGLLTTLAKRQEPLVYLIADDWLYYGPWADAWTRRFSGRPRLALAVRLLTRLPTGPPGDLGTSGAFCFVSDFLRRRAQGKTPWHFPLTTVVYGGIDTRDFPPLTEPPSRPWRWRLLCVGRLRETKGAATAVRALAALPEAATLDLIGYGSADERTQLERLAGDLGVAARVRFSACPRSELRERYLAADALLFPAAGAEGFGLVPLEAMACGTPVVATAIGGSGEFLFDGVNCLRVPPGDTAGLARAIERLAADDRLRHKLVAAGLQTAAKLTVDHLTDSVEAWLEAATERFAHGRPADRQPIRSPDAS